MSHRGCGRIFAGVGGGADHNSKGATGTCRGIGAASCLCRGRDVGGGGIVIIVIVVGDFDYEFPLRTTATGWGLTGHGRSRCFSYWSARAEGRQRARNADCDRSDGGCNPGRGSGRNSGNNSSICRMMDIENHRIINRIPGKKII